MNSDGNWLVNRQETGSEIRTKLISILNETSTISPPNQNFHRMLPKIYDEEKHLLTTPPSTLEIKTALWNIHPFKAPGEDGLHTIFFIRKTGILPKAKSLEEYKHFLNLANPEHLVQNTSMPYSKY